MIFCWSSTFKPGNSEHQTTQLPVRSGSDLTAMIWDSELGTVVQCKDAICEWLQMMVVKLDRSAGNDLLEMMK